MAVGPSLVVCVDRIDSGEEAAIQKLRAKSLTLAMTRKGSDQNRPVYSTVHTDLYTALWITFLALVRNKTL